MTIETLEHPVRNETARMRRQRHRHRRMMSILIEGLRDIPGLRPRRVPQAFVGALDKAALSAGDFAITTISKDGVVVTLAGVPNRFCADLERLTSVGFDTVFLSDIRLCQLP